MRQPKILGEPKDGAAASVAGAGAAVAAAPAPSAARRMRSARTGCAHVMGSGIADDATFTRFLEARLNAAGSGTLFEVLNFGVAAYSLTMQLAQLDVRVLAFDPDMVIFTDSPRLGEPVVQHLAHAVDERLDIPYPSLARAVADTAIAPLAHRGVPVPFDGFRAVVDRLGVATRMPWREAERRLRASSDALIRRTFDEMKRLAERHGAVPVFLALDIVNEEPSAPLPAAASARDAGLMVFDLLDLWRGRDQAPLRIAEWDNHPNPAGNRLIADRLAELMQRNREALRLPPALR